MLGGWLFLAGCTDGAEPMDETDGGDLPTQRACEPAVRGRWIAEPSLPTALCARTGHVASDGEDVDVFGLREWGETESVRVLSRNSTSGQWVEWKTFSGAWTVSSSTRLSDGRLVVALDDGPSLHRREPDGSWTPLGPFPIEDARSPTLGRTSSDTLVAYAPRSALIYVSTDFGASWEGPFDAPQREPHDASLRVVPYSEHEVLLTGPELFSVFDVQTHAVTGPPSPGLSTTAALLGDEQWFALRLEPCCEDASMLEVVQWSPVGVLLEDGAAESVGFPCEEPMVTETTDLSARVLGRSTGLVAVLATQGGRPSATTLDIYEPGVGWARTPKSPVHLDSSQLTMLRDGSVLAIAGLPRGARLWECTGEVWRWQP